MKVFHGLQVTSILSALIPSIQGHLMLANPPPFKYGSPGKLLQVDPLDLTPGGSFQFPCQGGPAGTTYNDPPTIITPGQPVQLRFNGQAVHWGGSCQVALSKTPSANPKDWKVIHSIIGGFPATYNEPQSEGLPKTGADADGRPDGAECTHPCQIGCLKVYNINIDNQIPEGKYFFSWTWFNKAGLRREMYQNCAPIQVKGSSGTDAYFQSLPAMFASDVPDQCLRTDSQSVTDLPNPGNSTERSSHPWDQPPKDGFGGLGPQCAAKYGYKAPSEANIKTQTDECAGKWVNFPEIPAGVQPYAVALSPPLPVASKASPSPSANTVLSETAVATVPTTVQTGARKCDLPCNPGAIQCFGPADYGICGDDKCTVPQKKVLPGEYCLEGKIRKIGDFDVAPVSETSSCSEDADPKSVYVDREKVALRRGLAFTG